MRASLNEHNLIYYNNNIFMLNNKKLFKFLRNIKRAVETPPKALAGCPYPPDRPMSFSFFFKQLLIRHFFLFARGGCPHPPHRPVNFLFFFEQLPNSHFYCIC
ncbi:hypothetical protein DBR40_11340 [Pedobacter sp. KBW01]|nr:hypothetical protein DBR40_11340 [Pedobacter sp. KBW01]